MVNARFADGPSKTGEFMISSNRVHILKDSILLSRGPVGRSQINPATAPKGSVFSKSYFLRYPQTSLQPTNDISAKHKPIK